MALQMAPCVWPILCPGAAAAGLHIPRTMRCSCRRTGLPRPPGRTDFSPSTRVNGSYVDYFLLCPRCQVMAVSSPRCNRSIHGLLPRLRGFWCLRALDNKTPLEQAVSGVNLPAVWFFLAMVLVSIMEVKRGYCASSRCLERRTK